MKRNKGITLIALIITIIIMLILVGVTIQVVINSNLFDIAKDAGNRTETAYEEESTLGGVTINGKEYQNMDEYLNGPEPKLAYSVEGKVIIVSLADSYENYVANKSKEEKEQKYAELSGISSIEEAINTYYDGDREAYEQMLVTNAGGNFGTTTYIDTLNVIMIELGVYEEEYIANNGDLLETVVTVTDPAGNEYELYYAPVSEDATTSFTYTVNTNGNYKFTAVSGKGRTSELTVPVELEMGTFTLKREEYDLEENTVSYELIGTYSFVKGDTWQDLVGVTLSEGVEVFSDERWGEIWLAIRVGDETLRMRGTGGPSDGLEGITNEIIDGAVYNIFLLID